MLAVGLRSFSFDTSLAVLMPQSDPYLEQLERLQQEFPARQEVSFAFVPHNGEVFSPTALQALAELHREYRQIPLAVSIASVLGWPSPFGDATLFNRPLSELHSYSTEELLERREQALQDRFLVRVLLSPASDLAIATVTLDAQTLTPQQSRDTARASLALRDALQQRHPQVDIHVSSEALYEYSTREGMISDLTRLLPLVLLLCSAIICFSFRSLLLGVAILGMALLSVVMSVGSFGWLGRSFNTISVMAPLVVVTIAVANSVHIVSIFRQNLRTGLNKVEAMAGSLRFNVRPVTLTTITTAIGFASLNLASSPAISSFGSVVASGVIFAWLLSLLALPAAVLLLPATATAAASPGSGMLTGPITRFCRQLVQRHPGRLLWSVALLGAVLFAASFLNRTDFDRMGFIDEDSPLHDFYVAVSERMDRGATMIYAVDSRQEYGVVDADFLQQVDELSEWLRQQEEVLDVASLVEVVKTINQVLENNDPAAYRLPTDSASIEQHLLDYRQVQTRNFSLSNFVGEDLSLLRLFVTTRPMGNQQILDLNQRLERQFAQQLPEAVLLHGSSILLFARMDRAVTLELLRGFGLSLLLITLTLMIGMRSLYYGVLSTLPNLLPATFVFGVWGIVVGQIDPFVMMLFSISIGLVVDDSVHVLSAYQSRRAEGDTPSQSADHALARSGPALIITTTVMALGTCVLMAASTLFFQQAATLLVPIVVLALLLDLTFFPALLVRCDTMPH